jgi:hypothetical protein
MTFNDRRLFSTNSNANSIDEFQWQFDWPFLVRRNIERQHTHPPIVAFVQRWDDIRLEYFRQGFRHTAFSQFLRSHSNFFSHLKKEFSLSFRAFYIWNFHATFSNVNPSIYSFLLLSFVNTIQAIVTTCFFTS